MFLEGEEDMNERAFAFWSARSKLAVSTERNSKRGHTLGYHIYSMGFPGAISDQSRESDGNLNQPSTVEKELTRPIKSKSDVDSRCIRFLIYRGNGILMNIISRSKQV